MKTVEEIFTKIKVGGTGDFKPFQKGVIISINSVLEITNYLIEDKGYSYVLTGYLSQDIVENLFSILRAKHQIPNALQFKDDLKLVSVSQYMRNIEKSSYKF